MKRSTRWLLIAISFFPTRCVMADALEDAGRAFNRGDYRAAIQLFEKARNTSADCHIPFYIGVSRYRLQQLDEAIVNLASATSCDPKSIDFNIALAEAYVQKHDDNRALTTFQTVLKLDPHNLASLRSAASLYIKHDMSDEALPVLQTLVSLDGKNAQAAGDLAAAYAAHSQFAEARELFERAILLDPRNSSALAGLGNLQFKNDQYEQAVETLTHAIRLDGNAYELFVLRARAYSKLKKFTASLADFQAALQMMADDPEVYYYLSQTYRAMGREADSQQALEQFKHLRNQSTERVDSQRDAARLTSDARRLLEGGDLPGAVANLEKARDLNPRSAPVLFRLAGLYFENHEYDKADKSIREAIKLAPSQWDYHYLQGLIEDGEDRFTLAEQSLHTAVRLNPASAEAHNQLGELALRRNDVPVAIREFSRAAELAPGETSYRANLDRANSLARR